MDEAMNKVNVAQYSGHTFLLLALVLVLASALVSLDRGSLLVDVYVQSTHSSGLEVAHWDALNGVYPGNDDQDTLIRITGIGLFFYCSCCKPFRQWGSATLKWLARSLIRHGMHFDLKKACIWSCWSSQLPAT